jgi:hypothetical protein
MWQTWTINRLAWASARLSSTGDPVASAACRLAPAAGFTPLATRLCLVGEPHRDGPIRLRGPPVQSRPRYGEIVSTHEPAAASLRRRCSAGGSRE